MNTPQKILQFWFEQTPDMDKWFMKSSTYDEFITKEFGDTLKTAEKGELMGWLVNKDSFVAYIILVDQFSRQIYRGKREAFQNDSNALVALNMCIDVYYNQLNKYEKMFILMPYMHSENLTYQRLGWKRVLAELNDHPEDTLWQNVHQHTVGHMDTIEKFGRFPKRNAALSRETTEEEKKYIEDHPNRPY